MVVSVRANFADIYLRGMRDRSVRSETKLAREIQLADWSTAGNLSNRSAGVQIPRDICTRFGRYLYSTKGSWIIMGIIIWPASRAGKMNQILRCDWLPERARWSYLARLGLPAASRKKHFAESHIINPLLTKLVRSIKTQKKNLANIQPS